MELEPLHAGGTQPVGAAPDGHVVELDVVRLVDHHRVEPLPRMVRSAVAGPVDVQRHGRNEAMKERLLRVGLAVVVVEIEHGGVPRRAWM